MDVENVGVGANHLLKEVVAVLNGYLPRQSPSQIDGCDLYIAEEWQTKQAVVVKIGSRKQANIRGDLFYWGMLSCAHIMELTDCFYYDNYVYFVSPFYSHGSLHDILTGPDPTIKHKVNELLVRKWAKQLLIFLNRMHSMGLFHLNIRKKALFVDNLTNLKVGGLGYVTLYNDRYALLGRMDHVSPEILEHYPHSVGYDLSKVDVWSVGGLICELLSGFSISGPISGDTLADRLNRRLVIRQNLDSLMTLPALTAVSRGGRGFLSWLLKWEASARPTARQALKHPWLRDQEIRLELYQLDRLLSKMEGRAKIIPQLSLIHPMVPLIPHQGSAVVRPRLLAKSEIPNRQFKLGLTEERLHLSKHAWNFREHVLSVDEARREMWTALYDLLAASESRWQWEPLKISPGRQYKLPTKRYAPPADSMETGEPAYVLNDEPPLPLAIDSDDHERPFSFQLIGGFDTGRAALRGGAERRQNNDIGNSPIPVDTDNEDRSSTSTEVESSPSEDSLIDQTKQQDLSRPGFSGYTGPNSSDSALRTRRNSYSTRKRRLAASTGLKAKRRRLTSSKQASYDSSSDSADEGISDESLNLFTAQFCPYTALMSLQIPINTITTTSSTESSSLESSHGSIETNALTETPSEPFDPSIISMRSILKPIPTRLAHSSMGLPTGPQRNQPRASQSESVIREVVPPLVSDSVQSKEHMLAPFLTPRRRSSLSNASTLDDQPLNILLNPLRKAETAIQQGTNVNRANGNGVADDGGNNISKTTSTPFILSLPGTLIVDGQEVKDASQVNKLLSNDPLLNEPSTSFTSNLILRPPESAIGKTKSSDAKS